jgi:hypothetical protein
MALPLSFATSLYTIIRPLKPRFAAKIPDKDKKSANP